MERIASDQEVMARALRAYFATEHRESTRVDQPSSGGSGVEQLNGKWYAVLRNINGVMRVYRVRNNGALKRLRRWPRALEN